MQKAFAAILIGATVLSGGPVLAGGHGRGPGHGHEKHAGPVRYYGGGYGYGGYAGPWRTGQRFPYYANSRYVVYDYGRYGLPPPWAGYRYYRADNGDIVLAAIASGVIGLIIGASLGDHPYYPPPPPPPVYYPPPPRAYYPPPPPPYYPAPYYPRGPYGY